MNDPDSDPISSESLNYFNYFTEVEDEFVRRRGAHLLISPMDWALVESWKDAGIPLHVVLRGINSAFDAYDARSPKYHKVNSVLYCQQAVEEAFAEHQLSQVGAARQTGESLPVDSESGAAGRKAKPGEAFTRASLVEFIDRCLAELRTVAESGQAADTLSRRQPMAETTTRVIERLTAIRDSAGTAERIDPEALERDLDALDRLLLEALKTAVTEPEMEGLKSEAKSQLKSYRKKMDKAIYQQTVDNFIARRLREIGRVPRLSLFYMT
ncbi:MAG TPA: hypothetical protein VFV34_01995 [Blastocatellia bacterium]|nr:hypothetical protein [Blastocatellia bacterium]